MRGLLTILPKISTFQICGSQISRIFELGWDADPRNRGMAISKTNFFATMVSRPPYSPRRFLTSPQSCFTKAKPKRVVYWPSYRKNEFSNLRLPDFADLHPKLARNWRMAISKTEFFARMVSRPPYSPRRFRTSPQSCFTKAKPICVVYWPSYRKSRLFKFVAPRFRVFSS